MKNNKKGSGSKEDLKNILYRGKTLKIVYFVGVVFYAMFVFYMVGEANKLGLSEEEIAKQQKINEFVAEQMEDGHIGGEEKLILEEYKNEISTYDFESYKQETGDFYVYFYSPYCPYCAEVGETIVDVLGDKGVNFVVVDVNKKREFQERENASTLPKVVRYENGEYVDEIV